MSMVKLADVCRIRYGKDHKRLESGDVPVFGSGGVMRYVAEKIYDGPSVLIPRKGTLGNLFFSEGPFWTVDTLFWTEINESRVLPRYLYYALKNRDLASLNIGTAVPSLSVDVLNEVELRLPGMAEQATVTCLLGSLDAKVSLNNQINGYLLEAATARFEQALVNKRYAFKFSELVELEDSKRVPLNSRDRENRKGPYPYYGATSIMDYVDDYLFDGIRVLLGEDGTVIREDGRPVLQYVWGKYWVNNHAHILKAKADYSLEAIYIALARTAINHIVTGAVQMKISQKNLSNLELELPSQKSLDYLKDAFSLYRNNVEESKRLECLRDALLPGLMSGEIDVSRVDLTQLNSHLSGC